MEQSALKEAGNILASAYMNALSDFMGMMLLPSVPSLVIDLSAAVLTTAYLNFGHDRDFVFCVETEFRIDGANEQLRGHFLLLPDLASLQAIFDAIRVHLTRCPAPALSERDLAVLRSFARRIDPVGRRRAQQPRRPLLPEGADRGGDRRVRRARSSSTRRCRWRSATSRSPTATPATTTGASPELQERLRRRPTTATRAGSWAAPTPRSASYDEAVAEFEALLAYHPSDVAALIQLGLAEKARGDLEVARRLARARPGARSGAARWHASTSARCSTTAA